MRIKEIIRQTCDTMGVRIIEGVLSRDHIHMFVEIPPSIVVSDFVQRVKGRSSHKVQRVFLYDQWQYQQRNNRELFEGAFQ